jgi:hypothetical protein
MTQYYNFIDVLSIAVNRCKYRAEASEREGNYFGAASGLSRFVTAKGHHSS